MTATATDFTPLDPQAAVEVAAGPVSLTIINGAVRWVRARGLETVRGIYGAVRDPSWGTIEPVFTSYAGRIGDDAFEIRFRAECRREGDGIDVAWTGCITGTREGTVRFVFDGLVRSPFLTPRIGLCVLHPPRLAGEPIEVTTLFGRTRGRFPDLVTGFYPFSNVTRIRHDLVRLHETRIDFAGDVFEMQDQRAFTDASFKTFSRPLGLPQPYMVDVGTGIRQILTVSHPRIVNGRSTARPAAEPDPTVIRVGAATGRTFPAVGTNLAPADVTMSPAIDAAVRDLRPAHLRVVLDAGQPAAAMTELERGLATAAATGAGLEVVLVAVPEEPAIDAILARLAGSRIPVVRLLAVDTARHATTAALAGRIRDAMRTHGVKAPLAGGSRGHLYQLVVWGVPGTLIDEVAYPANPQVHAFDDASILETIEALPAMVRTAAALAGGRPVAVGPISLRQFFNPDLVGPGPPPPPGGLPARYDPRQPSAFTAAWTFGTAAALANAGVVALTLHEAAGWAGLVAARHVDLSAIPVAPGVVLPVGRVVEALAAIGTQELMAVEVPQPLAAVAVRRAGGELGVLVGNLGTDPVRATVAIARRACQVTDVAGLECPAEGPAAWVPREVRGGMVDIEPLGVVRLRARDGIMI
jgi:hypothetical protein